MSKLRRGKGKMDELTPKLTLKPHND